MGRKKSYESGELTVFYEPGLCIHAAECVHGLPGVFDPNRKPWIDVGAAATDAIVGVVEKCPTGALTYALENGGGAETPDSDPTICLDVDGPLYVRGAITIVAADGTETEMTRVALCRCGHSENKPFCDNSHVASSFRG